MFFDPDELDQDLLARMDIAYDHFQEKFGPIYKALCEYLEKEFDLPEQVAATVLGRGFVTLGALNIAYGVGNDLREPAVAKQCGDLSLNVLDYAVDQANALYQENC